MKSEKIEELHNLYSKQLHRYITKMIRDQDAAKDILQETFVALFRFRGEINQNALKSWLYKTAYRFAIKHKKNKTEKFLDAYSSCLGPEDVLMKNETVNIVKGAIDSLPETQRQIIKMKIYENKTFAEISKALKIPIGTALSRERLAKEKIMCDILPRMHMLRFG
jgi:RNA polymerase sigma-70 factor (ECF subfamily)